VMDVDEGVLAKERRSRANSMSELSDSTLSESYIENIISP
jgi:hypothetical protein